MDQKGEQSIFSTEELEVMKTGIDHETLRLTKEVGKVNLRALLGAIVNGSSMTDEDSANVANAFKATHDIEVLVEARAKLDLETRRRIVYDE